MIAALLALQTPFQGPSAGPIVSKMLSRYASATSAQGTILTKQSARNVTITTRTDIALEKPAKLRIDEMRDGKQGGHWLVVSDGTTFGYDRPPGIFGPARFKDPVEGTLTDLYTAVSDSIGEKSPPLDILIGRKGDLQTLVGMWGQLTLTPDATLRGEKVELASGKFRKKPGGLYVGTVEIVITPDGELRRYTQKETYTVPGNETEQINVTTVYDVAIKLDSPISGSPFRVE